MIRIFSFIFILSHKRVALLMELQVWLFHHTCHHNLIKQLVPLNSPGDFLHHVALSLIT
ncbi:hypothetical protein GLYMA_05G161751v4 [Glycine max]|nr:hypothetical protein GYH30_012842 [Glycine max]KRH59031.2 hypothetical protein GLYMA_05G161751v4 [Glycine max]